MKKHTEDKKLEITITSAEKQEFIDIIMRELTPAEKQELEGHITYHKSVASYYRSKMIHTFVGGIVLSLSALMFFNIFSIISIISSLVLLSISLHSRGRFNYNTNIVYGLLRPVEDELEFVNSFPVVDENTSNKKI